MKDSVNIYYYKFVLGIGKSFFVSCRLNRESCNSHPLWILAGLCEPSAMCCLLQ